jgi:hypothetical protein
VLLKTSLCLIRHAALCIVLSMGTKSNKDPNLFAKHVFDNLLDKLDPEAAAEREPEPEGKDPKKQAAGRKGGKKGGTIRTSKLSQSRRAEIARKAALTRWGKTETEP